MYNMFSLGRDLVTALYRMRKLKKKKIISSIQCLVGYIIVYSIIPSFSIRVCLDLPIKKIKNQCINRTSIDKYCIL